MKPSSLRTTSLIPLVFWIYGCEVNFQGTHNSSEGVDDYVEEPVTGPSKNYTAALETSNNFIVSFSEGRLADARRLFDLRMQEIVSEEHLQALYSQSIENFGAFVEYKPMQWGFSRHTKLDDTIVSVKIVIHEKTPTFYVLNFEDNGRFDRIIGFNITRRRDGERVADAVHRAHGAR